MTDMCELLRVPLGPVRLADYDPDGTPGFDGGKKSGKKALRKLESKVVELQTKLSAEGYTGGHRSVLIVLQGMDTAGKGGAVKHAAGLLNPGGLKVKSFRAPTEEELSHYFLWRVERETPAPGQIGIFDRSHYEDVLITLVHQLFPADVIDRRYDAINDFEARLAERGTRILKCFLHISPDEQRDRLLARLDDPTKVWKFKPEDIQERSRWQDYEAAYEIALERCNTEAAPWYVIPCNHKWYRSLAIASLLRNTLRDMDLSWPEPDFDVEEQKRRLAWA